MKKKLLSFMIATMVILSVPIKAHGEELKEPAITGEYAITLDADTGEVIYAKNADGKTYPASITKLITAILVDENLKKSDTVIYSQKAKLQPTSSINRDKIAIPVGEQIPAEVMLKSMLLPSANDMAEVAATNIPTKGSNDDKPFITMMNKKAEELGMKNTHFVTANGLDNYTTEHKTTAYDLTILGRAAYKEEWIRDIWKISNDTLTIPNLGTFDIHTTNKFMRKDTSFYDSSCLGGKTGYTDKAGRCLLTIFERNGRKIIGVVLKSSYDPGDLNVFNDMKKIIDYSFSVKRNLLEATDPLSNKDTIYKKGTTLTSIPVKYKVFKTFGPTKTINVPVILDGDISIYKNEINSKDLNINYNYNIDIFSSKEKNELGTVTVKEREHSTKVAIYTNVNSSMIRLLNNNDYSLLYGALSAAVIVFIIMIVIMSKILRHRKKKKNRNKYKI